MVKTDTTEYINVERRDNQYTENQVLVETELVKLDLPNSSVTCSCHFFENSGLICRHTMRVLDAFAAWGYAFCHSIPPMYVKKRWCRDYKKSLACFAENSHLQTKAPSNFGERYKRLSDILSGAGSRICYHEAAFNAFLRHVLDGVKEAEELLHSTSETSEPSRAECSTLPGICYFISIALNETFSFCLTFMPFLYMSVVDERYSWRGRRRSRISR